MYRARYIVFIVHKTLDSRRWGMMKVDSYVQQGLRKQLAPPHHWQVGNVPWQMGKYCLQLSVQFYAEMQAAMVNLEIFSKIVS